MLFGARERLVHQRTELVNALRAVLYEFGCVIPQGIENVKLIDAILEQPNCDLPALVRIKCADLIKQIAQQTANIETETIAAKEAATTAEKPGGFRPCLGSVPLPPWRQKHSPQRCKTSNVGVTSPPGLASCQDSIPREASSDWGAFPRPANATSVACSSLEQCLD